MTRPSVALSFDFDALSVWLNPFAATTPSMLSRGEFGAVAVPRILTLLERHEAKATFFVPGHTALAYPELVRRIAADGHEIGHHGHVHENPAVVDAAAEREALERGFEALDGVAGVRPSGYRSPGFELSQSSVDLLLEAGLTYDSSCMGHDFQPYYLRHGDRPSQTEPFGFGEYTELVELPVSWHLDDFPSFEFVPGLNRGLANPSAVEEIWREEWEFAVEHEPDGLFTLTLHPQVIGRGHRLRMLDRLLAHVSSAGARFERLGDVAARWRAAHPLADWVAEAPVHAR